MKQRIGSYIKRRKIIIPLIGLFSLIWFFIRVIPKPSRASYPCMRAAFPFASAFVFWLIGTTGSILLIKRARTRFRHAKYLPAMLVTGLAVVIHFLAFSVIPGMSSLAAGIQERMGFEYVSSYVFPDPVSNVTATRSTVAIVQSEKTNALEIEADEIEEMIREAVSLVGGMEEIISDGDVVILKPNLVAPFIQTGNYEALSPGSNGVVTDFRVIQAAVNLVRDINPSGRIILMEGSALGTTSSAFAQLGWDRVTGLDEVVFLEDICLWQEKGSTALVQLSLPRDKFLYKEHNNIYYMSKLYHNADVVISIPCLKTHGSAGVTGGVKNVGIGATPSQIYGMGPSDGNPFGRWSSDYGIDHGWTPLNNWIHDFYMLRPVDFVIMDGLQGIQFGPGPHQGPDLKSNQMNMRLILAGKDAVAVDAIEALVMSHDPEKVLHLTSLHEDSLGCADPRYIEVVGMQVDEVEKQFGNMSNGNMVKHYDQTAPDPEPGNVVLDGAQLNFILSGDETLSRVDVMIDDHILEEHIVGGFDHVSLGLPFVPAPEQRVYIVVYDKYMNHRKIELNVHASSVEDFSMERIEIYPNPASSHITVRINSGEKGPVKIIVAGMNGVVVKSVEWKRVSGESSVEIALDDLPVGAYLLRMENGDHCSVYKTFIKR